MSFRNFILNQRIETMEHFIAQSLWKSCMGPSPQLKGRRCWGGLDLGATRDLTALMLVFGDDTGGFDALCRIWLPGDLQEAEDRDRVPYGLWVRQGHLLTFAGRKRRKRSGGARDREAADSSASEALVLDRGG